jgi:hypothetical protein
MVDVTLALSPAEAAATVEIEVTVQGRTAKELYRLITVPCQDVGSGGCVQQLRRAVLSIEPGWQLMNIGTPDAAGIPLLFRQRLTGTQLS